MGLRKSPVTNIRPEDLSVEITVPEGFNMFGPNRFLRFGEWLSHPIGTGDDPSSREYPIRGKVHPPVLGLVVDIEIYAGGKWWPQSKCFVNSDGNFSGSVWIHNSLPKVIFRFDILDSDGERLNRFEVGVY